MPFCPNCGKEVSKDTKFCPKCGQRLKEGFTPEDRQKYIEEFKASVEGEKPPKKTKMSKKKLAGIIGSCIIAVIVIAMAISSQPTATHPSVTTTYEPPIPAHFTTYTLEGLFSISYPSNWQVITSTIEEMFEDVKGEIQAEDPTVYLENITVLFGAGNEIPEGYYYPSVNIATDLRSLGYRTLEEVHEATSLYERENTPGYKELSVNWTKVDGRDAVITDSEDNEPGYGRWWHTHMLTVQGDFVWLVSCSCEYQDFDGYEDTFHSIVRSLRILN